MSNPSFKESPISIEYTFPLVLIKLTLSSQCESKALISNILLPYYKMLNSQ